MIGWIVFFSIIGFFTILLLSSLKIALRIDEKIYLRVSFLFFTLYKHGGGTKQVRSRRVKKATKDNKNSFIDILKKYASSKNKLELVSEIFEYLKILLSKLKNLLSHTRFNNVIIDLTVATDNASDTALLYGKMCSVVYPVISLLDCSLKFKPKNISVRTDFTSDEISFAMSGTLKVRLIHILGFVLSTAFSIIKLKIGDINNGKQS